MNEQEAAKDMAAALAGTAAPLTFVSKGDDENGVKPYGRVALEDFEEHEIVLGNWDGELKITIRSVPEDTEIATVDAWAQTLLEALTDLELCSGLLAPRYKAVETWGPVARTSMNEGVRETELTVSASLVQLA